MCSTVARPCLLWRRFPRPGSDEQKAVGRLESRPYRRRHLSSPWDGACGRAPVAVAVCLPRLLCHVFVVRGRRSFCLVGPRLAPRTSSRVCPRAGVCLGALVNNLVVRCTPTACRQELVRPSAGRGVHGNKRRGSEKSWQDGGAAAFQPPPRGQSGRLWPCVRAETRRRFRLR